MGQAHAGSQFGALSTLPPTVAQVPPPQFKANRHGENTMTYESLLETFRQNSVKQFDNYRNPVINSDVRSMGCTVPFVRRVAKGVTLEQAESFPVHDWWETDLLRAIKIADCKLPYKQHAAHILAFADTIENWAVCDNIIKVRNERESYFALFCGMLTSDKPFVCRYGAVNLMGNFLDDAHVDVIFAQLAHVTQWGHYYVDMGIAWLVATAMAKCRDRTVEFMQGAGKQTLSKFAYNKALQKMRESYRVSDQDKRWTYTQKIQ